MAGGVSFFELGVGDPTKGREFYGELFGWTMTAGASGEDRGFQIQTENIRGGLHGDDRGAGPYLFFEVEDAEVLTRYLAKELGARGISVNTLAPGAIATDFGGGRVRDNAQLNAFVASQTALGRAGLPDDIGNAVAALLVEPNGWINVQRIEASGGMFI